MSETFKSKTISGTPKTLRQAVFFGQVEAAEEHKDATITVSQHVLDFVRNKLASVMIYADGNKKVEDAILEMVEAMKKGVTEPEEAPVKDRGWKVSV